MLSRPAVITVLQSFNRGGGKTPMNEQQESFDPEKIVAKILDFAPKTILIKGKIGEDERKALERLIEEEFKKSAEKENTHAELLVFADNYGRHQKDEKAKKAFGARIIEALERIATNQIVDILEVYRPLLLSKYRDFTHLNKKIDGKIADILVPTNFERVFLSTLFVGEITHLATGAELVGSISRPDLEFKAKESDFDVRMFSTHELTFAVAVGFTLEKVFKRLLARIAQTAYENDVSNVVATVDRFVATKDGRKLLLELVEDPGFDLQVREWESLGMLDESIIDPREAICEHAHQELTASRRSLFLPIDSKFFSCKAKERMLNLFEHDKDGIIHVGDSYVILRAYADSSMFNGRFAQTIFIDPPFNKPNEANYKYRVKIDDDLWIAMLRSRLRLARELLRETGSIFVRCDYEGSHYVHLLLDEIFGKKNFRNEIIVKRSNRIKSPTSRFLSWHDVVFFYAKRADRAFFKELIVDEEVSNGWRGMDMPGVSYEVVPSDLETLFEPWMLEKDSEGRTVTRARLFFGKPIMPPSGRRFPSQAKINEETKKGNIRLSRSGRPLIRKRGYKVLTDDWTDIFGYKNRFGFTTENSEELLRRVITATSEEGDVVLDFFAGSGTALAVAHKLGRKWVGVEINDHAFEVLIPRMKKVLFYDGGEISSLKEVREKYNKHRAGGVFYYYSYE